MTNIIVSTGYDTPYGVQLRPASAHAVAVHRRIDGTIVVMRTRVPAVTENEKVVLKLAATSPGNAWQIVIRDQGGDTIEGWYSVPDVESINFTELAQVDPDSLEPTAEPDPAWWAMANATVESGTVNSAGELVLKRTDGKTMNAGRVKGDRGPAGSKGNDGTRIIIGDGFPTIDANINDLYIDKLTGKLYRNE